MGIIGQKRLHALNLTFNRVDREWPFAGELVIFAGELVINEQLDLPSSGARKRRGIVQSERLPLVPASWDIECDSTEMPYQTCRVSYFPADLDTTTWPWMFYVVEEVDQLVGVEPTLQSARFNPVTGPGRGRFAHRAYVRVSGVPNHLT